MSAAAPAAFDALDALLRAHGEAVRAGDTDTMERLAEQVRQAVAAFARQPGRIAAADRSRLQSLLRQCLQTQARLARRQADVARSLQALSAAAPQADLSQRVYGANGSLSGLTARGRGSLRA